MKILDIWNVHKILPTAEIAQMCVLLDKSTFYLSGFLWQKFRMYFRTLGAYGCKIAIINFAHEQ